MRPQTPAQTHRVLAGGVTLLALFTAAACGSATGDDSSGTDSGEDPAPESTLTVTVGAIPIVDAAPLWLAEDLGYFEDEGVEVTIERASSGGAIVPSVVSGEFDIGFGNYVSTMIAISEGFDLRWIAAGAAETADLTAGASGVVTLPDSGIDGPEDLSGHSVSVNSLVDTTRPAVSTVVERAGGDASRIEFIELNFPEVIGAIQRGDVDAGYLVEPFLTMAQDEGLQVVTFHPVELDPDFPMAGYYTSVEFGDADPEAVERFRSALVRAQGYADEHPDEVRRIVASYTEIPEDVLARVTLSTYPQEIDVEGLQDTADMLRDWELISTEMDIASLVWEAP